MPLNQTCRQAQSAEAEQWLAGRDRLKDQIGPTWVDFAKALGTNFVRWAGAGGWTVDANQLLSMEVDKALQRSTGIIPALCQRALRRRAGPLLLQRGEHRRRSPPYSGGTPSDDQTPWRTFEETGPEDKDGSWRYRHARGTYTYCLPAANDSEAVQYIGAVAFHSWGGASPKDYRAWSDLADRLKLPLLDTELGVDLRAKPHAGELPRGICAGQPRGAAGAGSG